ncbi:MAG: hypothetical protein R3C46_10555 [Hyphomonadaceae bacterium]
MSEDDRRLATEAMRANAAVNSGPPMAKAGGRKKLAQLHSQLSSDPERLGRVTMLATQMSGGNFSWHL